MQTVFAVRLGFAGDFGVGTRLIVGAVWFEAFSDKLIEMIYNPRHFFLTVVGSEYLNVGLLVVRLGV